MTSAPRPAFTTTAPASARRSAHDSPGNACHTARAARPSASAPRNCSPRPYDPHAGLCVVGVFGRDQIVEVTVQVRHLKHGNHPRDRLVLGRLPVLNPRSLRSCPPRSGHEAGVAAPTDTAGARPKKNPAVINNN